MISLDGTTGIVVLGAVDLVLPELTGDLDTILEWADEFRTLGVRANAATPRMLSCPATSVRRASACAAPSTCSWATASRSSRRSS